MLWTCSPAQALTLAHSASPRVPSTRANAGLWLVAGCCSGDAAGAYEYWFAVSLGNHLQHVQTMLDPCQHFSFIQLWSAADKIQMLSAAAPRGLQSVSAPLQEIGISHQISALCWQHGTDRRFLRQLRGNYAMQFSGSLHCDNIRMIIVIILSKLWIMGLL